MYSIAKGNSWEKEMPQKYFEVPHQDNSLEKIEK